MCTINTLHWRRWWAYILKYKAAFLGASCCRLWMFHLETLSINGGKLHRPSSTFYRSCIERQFFYLYIYMYTSSTQPIPAGNSSESSLSSSSSSLLPIIIIIVITTRITQPSNKVFCMRIVGSKFRNII